MDMFAGHIATGANTTEANVPATLDSVKHMFNRTNGSYTTTIEDMMGIQKTLRCCDKLAPSNTCCFALDEDKTTCQTSSDGRTAHYKQVWYPLSASTTYTVVRICKFITV